MKFFRVLKGPSGRQIFPLKLKRRAIALIEGGMTTGQAANKLGVKPKYVSRWLHEGFKRGAKGEVKLKSKPTTPALPAVAMQAQMVVVESLPRKQLSGLSPIDTPKYLDLAEKELIRLIREEGVNNIAEDRALFILALRAHEKSR